MTRGLQAAIVTVISRRADEREFGGLHRDVGLEGVVKLRTFVAAALAIFVLAFTGVALAGHYHRTDWWDHGIWDANDEDNWIRPEVRCWDGVADEKYVDLYLFGSTFVDDRGPSVVVHQWFDYFPHNVRQLECEYDSMMWANDNNISVLGAHVHAHHFKCF